MAWIESHQTLGHHPKTLRLAHELKCSVPCAVGYLHFLWWWALDYAPDGVVDIDDRIAAARACLWNKGAAQFWSGLVVSGFADREDDEASTLRIHDWMEYAGKLAEQRALRKASNRRAQAKRRQHKVSAESALVRTNSQQSTGPDLTGPNRTTPPVPPPPVSADATTPTDSIVCYGCEQTVDTMDYKRQHKPDCDYFGLYPLEIRARRGMLNERAKREAKKAEPVSP